MFTRRRTALTCGEGRHTDSRCLLKCWPHQGGVPLSLPIRVKTSLFPLWSCTCPCFCECSVCTCSSFSRKFIDRNITLMLKSNTLTDVLESKEECTIFQNYCAYLLILSFASDIHLGKCLKTFVFFNPPSRICLLI